MDKGKRLGIARLAAIGCLVVVLSAISAHAVETDGSTTTREHRLCRGSWCRAVDGYLYANRCPRMKARPGGRHLERHDSGAYHYPAVVQGEDDRIHVVYSYFVNGGQSMKHTVCNESWVKREIE